MPSKTPSPWWVGALVALAAGAVAFIGCAWLCS